MLKAPSFECVFDWRMEQEKKLRASLSDKDAKQSLMDEKQVERFIKFYQRITEHTLKTLPPNVDYLYEMDSQRKITQYSNPNAYKPKQWLIFTDMDGSLLDHHTYRYDEALPVLKRMEANDIPVIPISSKTKDELASFRSGINNTHPFIIENGAAVYIPVNYFKQQPLDTILKDGFWVKEFVESRSHWQSLIDSLRPEFGEHFKTFSDVGIDGIMKLTGLDVHAAAKSARRGYGEPISWHGNPSAQKQFIKAIQEKGANVLIGGRFMHVSGKCDKGIALNWLAKTYQRQMMNKQIQTLAIGDSHNDKAMLETAQHALIIRSPVHPIPEINKSEHLYVSQDTGPKGWAEGVSQIVDATLHPDSQDLTRGNHG
jgi:mannosyl-3-phosphoglycerate phosphatase family protein